MNNSIDNKQNDSSVETLFKNIIVRNPGIHLLKDEMCIYFANAYIGKEKTRTVGYRTQGIHASSRFLGLLFRSGSTRIKRRTETYWEKTPCRFYVTSDRFIAVADKGSFSVRVEKVLDIKLHSDAFVIYCENKTHFVLLNESDAIRLNKIWEIVGLAKQSNLDYKKYM